MSLAAIVFVRADEEDAYAEPHTAAFAIAGQSLIEYQVRCANLAGAQHILLYVEQINSIILSMIDQLSADGIKLELVRTAIEAGDHIHPEELVLIIASDCVAEPALLSELAQHQTPCLIMLLDNADTQSFERIDATTRWSGLGLISGALLRETSADLGEWDFCSTLLRRGIQKNIDRQLIDINQSDAAFAAHVTDKTEADVFTKQLMRREKFSHNGLVEYFLWRPITKFSVPLLLKFRIEPVWFTAIVGLFGLLTLAVVWQGFAVLALLLFIISGFAVSLARRLRALSLHSAGRLQWLVQARVIIGGISLIIIAKHLMDSGFDYSFGWGCLILSFWTLIEMFRISWLDPWFMGLNKLPIWQPTPDSLAVILLVFIFYRHDILGLELMTLYTVIASLILSRPKRS